MCREGINIEYLVNREGKFEKHVSPFWNNVNINDTFCNRMEYNYLINEVVSMTDGYIAYLVVFNLAYVFMRKNEPGQK